MADSTVVTSELEQAAIAAVNPSALAGLNLGFLDQFRHRLRVPGLGQLGLVELFVLVCWHG